MKSPTVWKIQALSRPSEAHAADAIEIVGGEAVRRVTLPQLDYAVYLALQRNPAAELPVLAHSLALPIDTVTLALQRLAAAGLADMVALPRIQ